jgi:hypothetical protein
VQRVQLGSIQLVDSDGQALPRLAAAYPAAVAAVLRALFETTGVDITALLARGRAANGVPPAPAGGKAEAKEARP